MTDELRLPSHLKVLGEVWSDLAHWLDRALGLAHHWQRLLDEQRMVSVAEIAEAEGIDVTQVRRVLRLTLLAPEVLERLAGLPDAVLEKVMRRPWPYGWSDQVRLFAPPT
jgi:hypothetical protein